MFYDYEFEFDSFGTVIQVSLEEEEAFEQDMMDDPFDDCYEEDPFEQFFEDQLMEYADTLRARIRNGEPIYSSQIDVYADLFKDVYNVRPHGMLGWLTSYENIIDDYAEIRAQWSKTK